MFEYITGSKQASDWLRENLWRKLLKSKIRFGQKLQKMHKVLIKQKLHFANRSLYAYITSALLLGIPIGVI